jgi:ribosomal protein S18 acetylase RimI-like enzyme
MIIERGSGGDTEQVCAIDEIVSGRAPRRELIAAACEEERCWVARDGAIVRGFAIADHSLFDKFFVALLIVHPEWRRRGIATSLMRAAELGCDGDRIFTSTNASNTAMQKLCERIGFTRSGIIENLDQDDPELIYVKRVGAVESR